MKLVHFLPATMILLSILSSAGYFAAGDWRHGMYWAASAVLIVAVTV